MKIGNLDISSIKVGSADCKVYLGDTLVYPSDIDYSTQYLTFVAKADGTFKLSGNTVSFSLDSGRNWSTLPSNSQIYVPAGDKIMWKGTLTPSTTNPYGIGTFSASSQFDVEGNAMSLLFGDNFIGQTDLTGKNEAFHNLFSGCTNVVSAENMVLPATTLEQGCYNRMFSGCTSLTTAPALPAITLASNCYNGMFYGCTSLTTAPELPATTLAGGCYGGMFQGCTSLTTAPELPATTLEQGCYFSMFQGCTSLTTAPELPATSLPIQCYSYMFRGCTSLTTAPALPATTLAISCYQGMFNGCTNLNSIKCLATNNRSTNCTNAWVYGVAATGTFTKASSMTGWTTGPSGIPNGWTVVDA